MASVNLDVAQRLDITCRKGDSFSLTLDFGQSVSGTWAMKVLASDDDNPGTSLITFEPITVTNNEDAVTDAKVIIEATAANMNVASGTYVYDLQRTITSSGVVTTYLYGVFKINEDVT